MLRCIVGEDRSGVQALATACEGLPEIYNVGDIFNPAKNSKLHEYFNKKRFSIAEIRSGAEAFHLYREFFEFIVNEWTQKQYSKNGMLFTIKYATYIQSPGLSHYLDSAGVTFLHLHRRDLKSLVTSILYCRDWRPSESSTDKAGVLQVLQEVTCRRKYFGHLADSRQWPTLQNEDVFGSSVIQDRGALDILSKFFGIDGIDLLIPSTRPTFQDKRRAMISTAVDSICTVDASDAKEDGKKNAFVESHLISELVDEQ